jgi:hypothetical protein
VTGAKDPNRRRQQDRGVDAAGESHAEATDAVELGGQLSRDGAAAHLKPILICGPDGSHGVLSW